MWKAGYAGEAFVGTAEGRLGGGVVEGSGMEEPLPGLELLLDAFVEILEYDITEHRISLELGNHIVGRPIERQRTARKSKTQCRAPQKAETIVSRHIRIDSR